MFRVTRRFLPAAALTVTMVVAMAAGAAQAHHGLDGEFDQTKVVKIHGVISRVDWINPHIYFTIDVKDAKGVVTKWQAESVPVAFARAAGVTKAQLLGDGRPVEVSGFAGRKDPHLMFGNKIVYADGHEITFVGFKE